MKYPILNKKFSSLFGQEAVQLIQVCA